MRLDHHYDGGNHYLYDTTIGEQHLVLAVPCHIGGLPFLYHALLDTGSTWCLLPPDLAQMLGGQPDSESPPVYVSSRLGLFEGWLARIQLEFRAIEGVPVSIEATWFVSEDWPGPIVIGWKGGLERIRSALDPSEDAFYFAAL